MRTNAEADTVEEAQAIALSSLPEGNEPIAIEVISDGTRSSVSATAERREDSIRRAHASLPQQAPEPRVVQVETELVSTDSRTFRSFSSNIDARVERLSANGEFGDLRVDEVRTDPAWSFLGLRRYVHTIDLVGDFRTSIVFERSAAVSIRSAPFDTPSDTGSAFSNPFLILGLGDDVNSARSVAQRANDLLPLIEMDLEPAAYLDDFHAYPLFAAGAAYTVENVMSAKTRLISDLDRLHAARFWFSGLDDETRNALQQATDFGQAAGIIDSAHSLPASERAYAGALIAWYQCVSGEVHGTRSRLAEQRNRWGATLERWVELHQSGQLTECVTRRAASLNHPTIDDDYLEDQADQMLIDVCEPVVSIAVAARDQGFRHLAESYIRLIDDLGLSAELRGRVLAEFHGRALQTLRSAIEALEEIVPLDLERVEAISETCRTLSEYGATDIAERALGEHLNDLLLILRERVKQALSVFSSADSAYFGESSFYIEQWNNAGGDMSTYRVIADRMQAHFQNITVLRTPRDESLSQLESLREVIGNATALTPAFPEYAGRLGELKEQVADNIKSVKKEYNDTEAHIRRNTTGMRDQLGLHTSPPPRDSFNVSTPRSPARSAPATPDPPPIASGTLSDLQARAELGDRDALLTMAGFYRTGRYIDGVFIPQDRVKADELEARAERSG